MQSRLDWRYLGCLVGWLEQVHENEAYPISRRTEYSCEDDMRDNVSMMRCHYPNRTMNVPFHFPDSSVQCPRDS